jgi:hypothetical protein
MASDGEIKVYINNNFNGIFGYSKLLAISSKDGHSCGMCSCQTLPTKQPCKRKLREELNFGET